jgi:16S rRNA (cytosine967-C5)-methyltransferase
MPQLGLVDFATIQASFQMIKNIREVAYDVLAEVAQNDAYTNLILPKHIEDAELDSRDAAFVTELVSGSLRMRGLIDAIVVAAGDREIERIDPPLRDVLRLGVYQILYMRVPDHAAVSTTVDLTVYVRLRSAGGFINAVLRRVSEKELETWVEIVAEKVSDELEKLSVEYSHPRWIVGALRDALGDHKNEIRQLLQRNNERPAITGVSRGGMDVKEDLLDKGCGEGHYSPFAVQINTQPHNLAEIRNGRAGVQDEGSQLVALTLAYAPIEGADENWLDLCAGPGGKAALLKYLASQRSAQLTAVELQAHRAKLVENSLNAISGDHKTVVADGTDEQFATGTYDRVLVDAPCTGLGVLRRRAESRWRRQPKDVGALAKIQRGLLENALRAIRPGGVVAYATCSPHLAETDFLIEDVMAANKAVRLLSAPDALQGVPGLKHASELPDKGNFVKLWPHLHDTDGMFIALLTRD